jgi:hypothetical protein
MRFDDTGPFLGAAERKLPRWTAYLMLAEMTRAVDQSPEGRSKRDDRLMRGQARVARTGLVLRFTSGYTRRPIWYSADL